MAGRKTKYTPEIVRTIIQALEVGAYQKDVCDAAGISAETFNQWTKRYPEFAEQVLRAKPRGWIADLIAIRKAAIAGDWRAAEAHLVLTRSPYRKSDVQVTVHIDREQVEQISAQYGLDPEEVIAEAERHLAASKAAA